MNKPPLDWNLLLAFHVLMTEGSVTKAAAKLNMSQPGMSGALARLRDWFDDPLFVRAGGRMRPTARARQLAGPIAQAVGSLSETLQPVPEFRFEASTRTFRLSASDYVEALHLGPLMKEIRRAAPGVGVRTIRPPQVFAVPEDGLRSGDVELALGLFAPTLRGRPEFLSKVLYRDGLVAVVRAGHPGVGRTLTLKTFLRLPQIRVVYLGDAPSGLIDSALASAGQRRDAALTVASMVAVPAIVARSDLLGVVPQRLAREWARSRKLRILELPIRLPELPLTLVWHESRHSDPANVWLRELIGRTLLGDRRPRGSGG